MTVDFILHGVPNGQDFWGANDDNHYFSTFYVQKSEREYLSIEARKVSGKSYCYYNYLKYNNVTASDGRAGAYLGITLRFDAYYKDILNIYQLFEIVYNNLLDTIFEKNGEAIKYKISKFEAADSNLNEIKKKVVNLIQLSATAKDFTALNDSFFNNEDKTLPAFLLDCTPDNVLQALKKYGKIDVSKYYPSNNEAKKMRNIEERFIATISQKDKDLEEKNQQISKIVDDCQNLKSNLSAEKEEVLRLGKVVSEKENTIKKNEASLKQVDELKSKIEKLTTTLQIKENEIKQKEKEINQLKIERDSYKENRKLIDLVKEIKMPLITLANYAGRQSSSSYNKPRNDSAESLTSDDKVYDKNLHEDLQFWEKSVFQIAKFIVLCLILCVTLLCAYQLCFTSSSNEMPEVQHYIQEAIIEEQEVESQDTTIQKKDTIKSQEDKQKK